jgi:hypothetical protein
VPVQRSSTRHGGRISARIASASIQASLIGRWTPGSLISRTLSSNSSRA